MVKLDVTPQAAFNSIPSFSWTLVNSAAISQAAGRRRLIRLLLPTHDLEMAVGRAGGARRLPWSKSRHGWLFALTLGLQEKRRSAVLSALVPIALDTQSQSPLPFFSCVSCSPFFPSTHSSGLSLPFSSHLASIDSSDRSSTSSRHESESMELGVWSFLMASAHGAGLMIVPFYWLIHGRDVA